VSTRQALAYVALALACTATAQAQDVAIANAESSAPTQALPARELVRQLRNGGLVIYFRHTATDFSRRDDAMTGYDDCANQRLLSAKGRDDAAQSGRAIRALKLSASNVLASPMCRTMEHARLAFGHASAAPELREAQAGDYPGLKRLLAQPAAPGTNRWIVGHGNPFRHVAGPPHLAEGEAAVIRPGTTHWSVIARLTIEQWASLESRR
jgi:Histidine phosphatase superfamily (branch 1)